MSDQLARIAAGPSGPAVGAFFDCDGTLVDGFTAVAHAGDRIRRGQARIGEVLGVVEASLRYKLGRMQFERLLVRAAEYLRGESLDELDEIGERLFAEQVVHKVYPLMRQIVEAHRERGHTLVLSSSALTIHAAPVARALGIPHVLCNTFELDNDGLLTGRINRRTCPGWAGQCWARLSMRWPYAGVAAAEVTGPVHRARSQGPFTGPGAGRR
jgi:HAD superfamily hydrolase (TIGR01490 family)